MSDTITLSLTRGELDALLSHVERPALTHRGWDRWVGERYGGQSTPRAYPTLATSDICAAIEKLERAALGRHG